jgi:hypothetical protein
MDPGFPPDADPRPWERAGAVRRDCAPHRGNWLVLLATVALVLGVLTCCLILTGLVAAPLAMAVDGVALADLERMRAGAMDPRGPALAEKARTLSARAMFAGAAGLPYGVGALVVLLDRL